MAKCIAVGNGEEIVKAFMRGDNGAWICVNPVTIDHPIGRIQLTPGTRLIPGTGFMGVDLAAWLEENFASR